MSLFSNPAWVDKELLQAKNLDEIPESRLDELASEVKSMDQNQPLVSVVISAWNEEINIIRCLDSLVKNKSTFPWEIVVINNNSTDRTQYVLDRIGVRNYFQPEQGVGPSRELGQKMAKGTYILSADADCIYPPSWVQTMTDALMRKGVVFVYGRFSYLSDENTSRLKLYIYEKVRDLISEVRNIKRPWLNSYGISLGYVRELGLKEGYLVKNIRGFDGRLCFDMMKHGKVMMVRSTRARAWTGTRAIERDGTFSQAIIKRILRELARLGDYFTRAKPHDTKTSTNRDYSTKKSVETLRKRFNIFRLFKK